MKMLKTTRLIFSLMNNVFCMELYRPIYRESTIKQQDHFKNQEQLICNAEPSPSILYYQLKDAIYEVNDKKVKALLNVGAPLRIENENKAVPAAFEQLWLYGEDVQKLECQKRYRIVSYLLDAGVSQEELLSYMWYPTVKMGKKKIAHFIKFCLLRVHDTRKFDEYDIKTLLEVVAVLDEQGLLDPFELFPTKERQIEALFSAQELELKILSKSFEWWLAKDHNGNTIFHSIAEKSKKNIFYGNDPEKMLKFLCNEASYNGPGKKMDVINELLSTKNNSGKIPVDSIEAEIKSIPEDQPAKLHIRNYLIHLADEYKEINTFKTM